MSPVFKIINKANANDDLVVLINKPAQIKKYGVLSDYEILLSDKIKAGKTDLFVFYKGKIKVLVLLCMITEKNQSYRLESIRACGSRIQKQLTKEKIAHAALCGSKDVFTKDESIAFLEGLALSNYQFNKYKSKKSESFSFGSLAIEQPNLKESDLVELSHVLKAVTHTKNLVNEPVITLTAPAFSNEIIQQGIKCGFKVEVLTKAQIKALKMGGLLGVNSGSEHPPTFSILTYKPKNAVNSKPLIFVGKGVVFDTGGYSLKISGSMLSMKSDMAGAAAVCGAISAISLNKLPVYVIGLIPATDNLISSKAIVVDDVITMHDGTTVEVQNTDAEGRLILADALSYAKKFNPELVIDLATLTGAAAAVTGQYGSAIMGNDTKYKDALLQAGEEVYERLIEMPFWREFSDLLKSDIADLRNIGGPVGGVSTAGKFLEHFTDYNWLHIDIAGPSFLKDAKDYHHKGASGVGVRLLYQFSKKFAKRRHKK